MNIEQEREFLEEKSYTYKTFHSSISEWSVDSYLRIYKRHMQCEEGYRKGLKLGCSSGYSTMCLANLLDELDVVDGSSNMIEIASKQVTNTNVHFRYSLFEELNDWEKYDYIFCSYVLEHVLDPAEVLNICHHALKKGGRLFVTVPNARALSRQMALEMGLLESLYSLTENDKAHGHRRVFDLEILRKIIEDSPFESIEFGGTFVKQYADFQINQMIDANIIGKEQLIGMQKLAEKYPDISGSIYAVLEKR